MSRPLSIDHIGPLLSNAAAKRWNAVSNIVPINIASIRLLNS